MKGFEVFHGLGDFLDEPVVLLDDVVQVHPISASPSALWLEDRLQELC